jgi:hypothetical protein
VAEDLATCFTGSLGLVEFLLASLDGAFRADSLAAGGLLIFSAFGADLETSDFCLAVAFESLRALLGSSAKAAEVAPHKAICRKTTKNVLFRLMKIAAHPMLPPVTSLSRPSVTTYSNYCCRPSICLTQTVEAVR